MALTEKDINDLLCAVVGTPSGSKEEKKFRELLETVLETVLEEAAKNRKDKTWQQPTPKK